MNISKIKREEHLESIRKLKDILSESENSSTFTDLNKLEDELLSRKYGLIFEEHREQVDEILSENLPYLVEAKDKYIANSGEMNFLIEGDNLPSLRLLQKTHKGGIDVIYIDPPYNTGSKTWKYDNDYVDKNDTYRHSKWLSMMNSRLMVAKTLLKKNGVLICAIDENEFATTALLLGNVFGPEYKVEYITVVHNPRGVQGNNFSYTHEYALFVYKKGEKLIGNKKISADEIEWSNFRNWGSESERTDAKNCFYPVIIQNDQIVGFGDVLADEIHPNQTQEIDGYFYVYPIDTSGIERKWRYARQSVESIKHLLRAKKIKNGYEIEIGKDFANYKTVWTDTKYDANEYGTKIVNMLVPESKFDFPKSIHTVYDCLYAVVGDRKNAIVLDFFAGSGTTGHAVLEMNSVDDGNRRFILCTNNEGGICEEITYPRISAVLKGYKYKGKKTEVLYSKPVTVTNFKNSSKILDEIEEVKRLNSSKFQTIQTGMKNGEIVVTGVTDSNVEVPGIQGSLKYLKVEFYPIADKMYLEYAGDIFEEITPLIEIENGVHLGDSEAIRLIRNEEEFENLMSDSQKNENLRKLYLWHDVLIDDDQRKLLTEKDIELIFLPDQYYDELERIQ